LTLLNCLRLHAEKVAAEVIDSEAIIINLSSGMYFTVNRVGALIWKIIQDGRGLEKIPIA